MLVYGRLFLTCHPTGGRDVFGERRLNKSEDRSCNFQLGTIGVRVLEFPRLWCLNSQRRRLYFRHAPLHVSSLETGVYFSLPAAARFPHLRFKRKPELLRQTSRRGQHSCVRGHRRALSSGKKFIGIRKSIPLWFVSLSLLRPL